MVQSSMRAPREGPILYRFVAAVVAAGVVPFVKIDTRRLDLAGQYRTGVVVTNHRSYFDVAVGLVAFHRLRRYPRVMVAHGWFERRATRWALRAAGAIPIDRQNPEEHLATARRILAAGIPILVLPEGALAGESDDPVSTGPFKTGAARLAHNCSAPVFALGIVGADSVWPRDRRLPRPSLFNRPTVLMLGAVEPIEMCGQPRADTDRIRSVVIDLLHEATAIRNKEL